ncbi:putative E3 ubiquitin-protein ligase HERC4 isoform X2 [Rhinoraja longicauda]
MLCWGNTSFGQLGLGGIDEEIVVEPRTCEFFQSRRVQDMGCGRRHTVFVLDDGTVYTCGCNDHGQLGHEKARKRPGSQVFSWGQNKNGQLGLGRDIGNQPSPQPVRSLNGVPFVQLAAGGTHSFALSFSGAVFGWGSNKFGQLGLNDEIDRYVPALLKSLRTQKIVYICCGEDHTATLTKEGGVFTFGAGGYGQLGHNSTNHEINPRKVFELMGYVITQISCGRQHTLAFVPSSGKIYSFGLGGNGQLGTGSTSNRKSPSTVKGAWIPYGSNTQKSFCVRKIFSGGDQSFAHYYSKQISIPPDDFRFPNQSQHILTINEAAVQKWMSYPPGRIPSDVANEVDIVFSSAGCLNGSFLALSNDDHYKTSSKFSGIDMNAARLLFHRLVQSDHPRICQQIAASMEKNLIPRLSNSPPDIEALRIYIILPECPPMNDANNYVTLTIPLAMAIVKLEKMPLKVLENWWAALEPAFFQKVVELYKDASVFLLKLAEAGMPSSEQIAWNNFLKSALEVLAVLHRVNERAGQIIQYDKFYIHEVQDLMDIRNDYVNWLQRQVYGVLPDMPITICTYPFVFDAQAKTTLLQTDAILQMQMAVDQAHRQNFSSFFLPVVDAVNPCLVLIVRRDHIVEDAVQVLRKSKNVDFKKPLKVIFVGEEAVDAGGVRKEFFLLIMRDLLDPKYGMFQYYEESRLIWFSFQTFEEIDLFHLIGVVCGLAIYNFTIVDLHFPLALYKKLLNQKPTLDDLKELMPIIGRSMQQLLDYPEDDVEDIFSLNFTITVEKFGLTEIKDLIPGGSNISVTKDNRQEFVDAYVDYVFNKSIAPLFDAFYESFHKVCGGKVLQLFQPNELQAMVTGNTNYDWEEWEKNTEYKGEYWAEHPTIKFFWEVFHELPLENKKRFLLFLTGSDRIPILGMKSLKFIIQPTGGGNNYLPVAHTCFNLLDLPKYTDKEILKSKLVKAIDHYEGFSLV